MRYADSLQCGITNGKGNGGSFRTEYRFKSFKGNQSTGMIKRLLLTGSV